MSRDAQKGGLGRGKWEDRWAKKRHGKSRLGECNAILMSRTHRYLFSDDCHEYHGMHRPVYCATARSFEGDEAYLALLA
jgi:hypothetical protein